MAKSSIQSDPVKYKDLYKRLEAVARDRDAQESKERRSSTSRVETRTHRDSTGSATNSLQSPPPPTAFSTRPVSSVPIADIPPRRAQSNRLSHGGNGQFAGRFSLKSGFGHSLTTDLEEFSSTKRSSAKVDARPSTSWNPERNGGLHSHAIDHKFLAELRPRSASYTSSQEDEYYDASNDTFMRYGSMRDVELIAQAVPIISQQPSFGMISPVTVISEDLTSPRRGLNPKEMSFDGSGTCASDFSTATTEVPAHSTSSSRSDRKSWNARSFISRFKDSRTPVDSNTTISVAQQPHISPVPPIHEFTFAKITPSHTVLSTIRPTTPVWEKPIPRPIADAKEPFRFYDYRFSSTSDKESTRASTSHAAFAADLDFGLGTSDSGPTGGREDVPTLMAGAKRRPETSTQDPNTKAKRDGRFVQPQTVVEAIARPYKESSLNREVSMYEAFDFHPDLALEDEPPEDDGIVNNFQSGELSAAPLAVQRNQSLPRRNTMLLVPDYEAVENTQKLSQVKRRSFNPRNLFASKENANKSSQNRKCAEPPLSEENTSYTSFQTSSSYFVSSTTTTTTSRPPTRSQPIVIMPHHQEVPPAPLPLPVQSWHELPALQPSQITPTVSSKISSSAVSRPSTGRPRTQSHIPIIAKIPSVPAFELAHMTPQSLALLREQEQLLARRSTISSAQPPDLDMLGISRSGDGTFQRPPIPQIPPSFSVPRNTTKKLTVEITPPISSNGLRSTGMATPGHLYVRRLSPAARSMLDLSGTGDHPDHRDITQAIHTNGIANIQPQQSKQKWWKAWKRA